MRILFITPYIPLYTKPRPFRFLEHLAGDHEIHLVAFDASQDRTYAARSDYQYLQSLCASMTLLPLPRLIRYCNVAASIASNQPARVAYYGSHRFEQIIGDLIQRHSIEAIHVDRLRLAPLAQSFDVPKVVDATDSISDYLQQCVRYVAPHLKPAYAFEAAKTARFERNAADRYTRCLVTTERERLLFRESTFFPRIRSIPNILDTNWFTLKSGDDESPTPTVVFAGNLSYLPNVDAVQYLVDKVWPHVRWQVPDARLTLAGAVPHSRVVRAAQRSGAEVTGFVPDLAALIASATVLVSPMRIGVGFPNKVAEAFALGKAIVSTSAGCRGLADSHEALMVADEPAAFGDHVAHLLRDQRARRRLGMAAREYAWQNFHPAKVKDQLDDVYGELVRHTDTDDLPSMHFEAKGISPWTRC